MDASWTDRFLHSLGGLTMVFPDAQVPARALLLPLPQARAIFPCHPNTMRQRCAHMRERKCRYLLSDVWGGFGAVSACMRSTRWHCSRMDSSGSAGAGLACPISATRDGSRHGNPSPVLCAPMHDDGCNCQRNVVLMLLSIARVSANL